MADVCLYFHVHQPERVKQFSVFDIGKNADYFDNEKNRFIIEKVSKKCYTPMNNLLLRRLKKYPGKFKVNFSITGVFLDQLEKYSPQTLDLFKELAKHDTVEIASETYYHSLAYHYSKQEFEEQVRMHQEKIKKLFKKETSIFRNTELIYNNELANHVEKMGFKGILAEGADHILQWRSPNYIYRAKTTKNMRLLLKNYTLSDDIAFRFGNKGWEEFPLKAEKFAEWLSVCDGEVVNLFMDYETFGEHQWEDTGIFMFMEKLVEILINKGTRFRSLSELAELEPRAELDIHNFISWADVERDLSAWLGNDLQKSAIHELYKMEKFVKALGDRALIENWRKLTTSDHFYYMCTKWFNDGDVHKYFNPYDSPYNAFINFLNVLNDIILKIRYAAGDNENMKDFNISDSPASALFAR
ncbi:MAG: glycoside hydrolase family 57 protein [Candidatus Woesearchaeota archaeon]